MRVFNGVNIVNWFTKTKLTKEEKNEGYFMDPVLGRCNIQKAMKERRDYEAYEDMHLVDGIHNKSKLSL